MLKRFSALLMMALAYSGLMFISSGAIAADHSTVPDAPVQMAQRPALLRSLILEDLEGLPLQFIEPPPAIAAQMRQQIAALGGQFQQSGINPDEFFVFVQPQTMQVIVGFTGKVSDTSTFDHYMDQARDPAMQALILSQIQARLEGVENVSVSDYRWLEGFESVGDRAASVQMDLALQGNQFKTQMVTFRQGTDGAFVALMHPIVANPPEGVELPSIALQDLTKKIQHLPAL